MTRLSRLAIVALVLGMPSLAWAQRGRSSGTAMTPYGPVSNPTGSAEWRQAGGNPIIYQQILEQKMMAAQDKVARQQYQQLLKQQQQQFKQQQAHEKWLKDQKAKKEKGKPVDPAYQQMLDEEARVKAASDARAARIAAKRNPKRSPAKKAAAVPTEVKRDEDAESKK